jgi:hypothetical protein
MPLHPVQIGIFRKMPGEEKLKIMGKLYRDAFELKKAALKNQYPDWPEEKILQAVRDLFTYGAIRNI